MGLLSKNICPKCGEEYSVLRAGCPKCGARRQSASFRSSAQSDTIRRGSNAQEQMGSDTRWQMIFGLCLVAAVIIAVIVLIMTTLNGNYETYATPTPSQNIEESQTPTPSPTPTPTPTPTVETVTITFLGTPTGGFAVNPGDKIQLGATVYPVEIEGIIEWSSQNADICTVDENGLVTGVSSGTTKVIARCYGTPAECTVWVK